MVAAKKEIEEEEEEKRNRERERERQAEAWERRPSRRRSKRRLSVTLRNVGAEDVNTASISPLRVDYATLSFADDDDERGNQHHHHHHHRKEGGGGGQGLGKEEGDRETEEERVVRLRTAERVRRLRAHLSKHLA